MMSWAAELGVKVVSAVTMSGGSVSASYSVDDVVHGQGYADDVFEQDLSGEA